MYQKPQNVTSAKVFGTFCIYTFYIIYYFCIKNQN